MEFLKYYFTIDRNENHRKSNREWRKIARPPKAVVRARAIAAATTPHISDQYGVFDISSRIKRLLKLPHNKGREVNPGPGAYDPVLQQQLPQPTLRFSQLPRLGIPVPKLHDSTADPRKDGIGFCESTKLGKAITNRSPTYRVKAKRSAFETTVPGPKYNPYSGEEKKKKAKSTVQNKYTVLACSRDAETTLKWVTSSCGGNVRLPGDCLHPVGKAMKIHVASRDMHNISGYSASLEGRISSTWESTRPDQTFSKHLL